MHLTLYLHEIATYGGNFMQMVGETHRFAVMTKTIAYLEKDE